MSKEIYDIGWLGKVYALLTLSCPKLIEQLHFDFPKQAIVAANIIATSKSENYIAKVTGDSDTEHSFNLDLQTENYYSKGNWIWVRHASIYCEEQQLLSLDLKKRVIDIPYIGTSVSAYWLLKNFYPELLGELNHKLKINVSSTKKSN